MTNRQRVVALANLISIPTERLSCPSEECRQFDVFAHDANGQKLFRVGYFDGSAFFRENPVKRALHKHGVEVREGRVGKGSEPQYDMHFEFDDDGNVRFFSDARTALEAGY